ncbi:MAG: hypothetical protein LBQ98_04195 [Nitrososphaerota archaeon]|jgi:hypothetical protein|nr:hypothetical protein [Nitrososphaerota archaeon]
MEDHCKFLLENFLAVSFPTVKTLVEGAMAMKGQNLNRKVTLFQYVNGKKVSVPFIEEQFYLRGSVEYANPQLTVEEIQGIIGIRMLAVCANYYLKYGLHTPTKEDTVTLMEELKKSSKGYIVPFLLNTDDVELDRYSMNPLRQSIIDSGQSAIPAANAITEGLKIDDTYIKKYNNALISKKEIELISETLCSSKGSYIDFVDSIKYHQLSELSKLFDMDLSLYSLRMPLSTLKAEDKNGLLHYIISKSNQNYTAIEEAYKCMGRSMNKRSTLLTVPHSKKGYGSKRSARGKLHFENNRFHDATITYKTTVLYPNGIDPKDVAIAVCDDKFNVAGEKHADYNFSELPSSPQFFLYSMASPEDAAVWHGVGAFGSTQLLQSYTNARNACQAGRLIKDLSQTYHLNMHVPLQFNLCPESLWRHPIHNNIDASVGSIENLSDLTRWGMKLEYLFAFK